MLKSALKSVAFFFAAHLKTTSTTASLTLGVACYVRVGFGDDVAVVGDACGGIDSVAVGAAGTAG